MLSVVRMKRFSCFSRTLSGLLEVNYCCLRIERTLSVGNASFSKRVPSLRMKPHDEYPVEENPKHWGKIIALNPDNIEVHDENDVLSKKEKKKLFKTKPKRLIDSIDRFKKKDEGENENSIGEKDCERSSITYLNEDSNKLWSYIGRLKSKREREKTGNIVLEGKRLIADAISAGHQPLALFFSRKNDIAQLNLCESVKLYKLSYKRLQLWSDVVTTQGVFGVFKVPETSTTKTVGPSVPLTVICDNVREPGNMGAILRVVASVGCKKLLLTKGCVNLWESKVLRSAAGSHFHLPILRMLTWDKIKTEIDEGDQILVADNSIAFDNKDQDQDEDNRGQNLTYSDDLPVHCYTSLKLHNRNAVIVIGGETHGLSREAYNFAKTRQGIRVHIPMANNIESLNTAVVLGILSYEVRRQLGVSDLTEGNSEEKLVASNEQN